MDVLASYLPTSMMRRHPLWCTLATVLLVGRVLGAQESPSAWLARATAAAGGERALAAVPAIEWDGHVTVHAGGRDIAIAGRWRIVPPDTALVGTWLATQDSTAVQFIGLARERGWIQRRTGLTPMPEAMYVEERHQFYLYALLRLLPLRAPGMRLSPLPPDSAGQAGILVETAGHPPVSMYADASGRVTRLVTRFAAPAGQPEAPQELRLSGEAMVRGVRWFRDLRILKDGKPYFDLHVDEARVPATAASTWIPADLPPARAP